MISFINNFNLIIFLVFIVFYAYQFFYVVVGLFHKQKEYTAKKEHKYAVVISARNESSVIGELVRSIKRQKYPQELLDVIVIADNCTDNTAEVSRQAGAIVVERENKELIGKGYALDFLFKKLMNEQPDNGYEGFFVFDADNLLEENYVAEMNKIFDQGYRVVTSYRNSKNYDTNWITAGYSQWFLREAKYLNFSRMALNTSCAISGTGFLVSSEIIKERGGWDCHLLTEDIEFTISSVIKGETIGYCDTAHFYDEQPVTFKQSWNQRLRWSKGFYQVFGKYGWQLVKTFFKYGKFACYDMFMNIMPALFVTLASIGVNLVTLIYSLVNVAHVAKLLPITLGAIAATFINFYAVLFVIGLITVITEWKEIRCSGVKKIFYSFTFPLFMFTYIPIAIAAIFKKVEWTPIAHSVTKSIDDIKS